MTAVGLLTDLLCLDLSIFVSVVPRKFQTTTALPLVNVVLLSGHSDKKKKNHFQTIKLFEIEPKTLETAGKSLTTEPL